MQPSHNLSNVVTIKIILEKRKPKKDGTYPIYFQICYNRKTRTRSTNIAVAEIYWDDTKKEIKRAHTDCKLLNQKLKKMFADIQSELLLADEEKITQYLNPFKEIAEKQLPVEKEILTVYQFAGKLIQDLKSSNKFGNAWVYEATVNALKGFHPEDDILFEQIDYEFLDAYQRHLNARDIKPNSVYLYVRTIRIFYNKAIRLKLVDKALYPFDEFKLKPEKTRKRAIDKDLISKIRHLDLEEGTMIWHVRNWFLLSFYLIGISIIDLALLTANSYINQRIEYKRRKTGKWYDIKVVPEAEDIIRIYQEVYPSFAGYLLPTINYKTDQEEKTMRVIKSRTKLINKYIKKLGEAIGYDGTITTYTVRHSWATVAKRLGFSNEVIAEALGHEYGNPITNVDLPLKISPFFRVFVSLNMLSKLAIFLLYDHRIFTRC